ncbi:hypothetical protein GCM10010358_11910 [Streptomyces minutiscleroticus]|uniref:Uncharacterized protein n=1 Tax=Streptomyces minutiscleroticus TaxID=68238 RepID=A0A918KCW2_9ACTN|nr:hypothetical protein GCM10010358_11910 [Streptomyces minutiscleroticus]
MTVSATPARAVTTPRSVSSRTAAPLTPASRSASASRCTDRPGSVGRGAAGEAAADGQTDITDARTTADSRTPREIMRQRSGTAGTTGHPESTPTATGAARMDTARAARPAPPGRTQPAVLCPDEGAARGDGAWHLTSWYPLSVK